MRHHAKKLSALGTRLMVLLLLACSRGATAEPAGLRIAVLSTQGNQRHAAVVASIVQALSENCPAPCNAPVQLVPLNANASAARIAGNEADLLLAIGSAAATTLAQLDSETPQLFGFIPRAAWHELLERHPLHAARSSAIFIDQPLPRQFALIRTILPQAKRIGVLLGAASQRQRQELRVAARRAGVALQLRQVDDPGDVGSQLRRLVERSDALMALPDPTVYNRSTIYPILLTTYSAHLPVFGFSAAMVHAGAAAAVYMSPEDAGRELAMTITIYQSTGALASPRFGERYSLSINHDVTRSLRLEPLSESQLLQQMKGMHP